MLQYLDDFGYFYVNTKSGPNSVCPVVNRQPFAMELRSSCCKLQECLRDFGAARHNKIDS